MRLALPFCIALAASGLTAAPTRAADVERSPLGASAADGALITVTGEFHKGDDRKLVRALLETEGTAIVQFESPGGSLIAGLAMGRAIRLNGATTLVPDEATCASACGLAWLGGVRRAVGDRARVGFHAAYYVDDQGRAIETGQGNALIGAYLNQLGLSERAVLYITGAAPEDMAWLSPDEAEDLGIPMQRIGAAAPPARAPERTATPAPAGQPRFFQTQPESAAPRPAALPPPGTQAPGGAWQIVHHAPAGYMNIRSGPGTNHPVLFTLAPSTPVAIEGCRTADPGGGSSQWCRIGADGRQGWVSRVGLEPLGTTAVPDRLEGSWQVLADAPAGYMNVRQGPGTSHAILFTVPPATPVDVVTCRVGDGGASGGIWCQITTRGQQGWIARSGLEPEGAAATRPAAPAPGVAGWRVKPDVSGGFANVRTGPGTMHSVAFALPAGATGLQVERCQPPDAGGGRFDWCLIIWQGRSGWVSSGGIEQRG